MAEREPECEVRSAADEYARRHGIARAHAARYRRLARRLIAGKRVYLASFIGYVVFDPTVAAVLLPVAISIIPLVMIQHVLTVRWQRHGQTSRYYNRALDRLNDQWIGRGDDGRRYDQRDHPYCGDLDIFGRGSLFQLFCTAHTAAGRDTLADWLSGPAEVATIRERQVAVGELRDQVDLRESIDRAGAATPRVDMETVRLLGAAKPIMGRGVVRRVVPLLAWMWTATFFLGLPRNGFWWDLFLSGLVVQVSAYFLMRRRITEVSGRGYQAGVSLVAASVFGNAVNQPAGQCPLLRKLAAAITLPPEPLHQTTAAVTGLLLQLPFPYFVAVQLFPMFEARLLRRLNHLPEFWAAVGQYEVLCAFAAQAYEHPDDCFPTFGDQGPCFIAEAIAHPLLADAVSVPNDVRLDGRHCLLMVSGSNMSGKSTLLRTVGVNAVLALAGATVRARSLRMSSLVIGSAMRFHDSLENGTSYFYSVLGRLRTVLDLLDHPEPLLFLLDEILQGTNSHDRLVGAEAVIRRLIESRAIGLVTTHDLELARVAEHLAPAAANVHFSDDVIDGRLVFDYRVRPGVVQSSNALRLMRDMGLDV